MSRYRTIRVPLSHPVALINGMVRGGAGSSMATVYEHKYVLYEHLGPGGHPCHWCGRPLVWRSGTDGDALIADHIDGDTRNNAPDNLVAACNGCNTIRARKFRPAIQPDERFVVLKNGTRTRADYVECEECGERFLAPLARIRRGTVKFCSMRCTGLVSSRKRWHPELAKGEVR